MTQPDVPVPVRLERVVDSLFRGDWRTARGELRRGGDAEGQRALVDVMSCLRRVANCQWLQCALGDVQAAMGELDRATDTLVRLGAKSAGGGRLLIVAEPACSTQPQHLMRTTTRLVVRERAELDALRLIFSDITRGGRELVYACAEHLTWVEFDPFTVLVHEHDQELLGLGDAAYRRFRIANPQDISARATKLRQFAAVRRGSVTSQTWHRMGGYGSVREAALMVLAGEQLTRGRADLSVRLGRACAVQYAKHWAKTLRPDFDANLV
ncbi:hypothetical protein [Pseudonocardia charpentierae]|uniref:Uncharacterized protein n=1 Tax=Pseudonocardia charpentierae TaxID=3075545 RepID=A0ABU2N6G5_9PSEU|nr:hypothetical protein [Pseudonocardia sp. DSM 45834]MDT0349535.1 hypothetical protein [Pseudonocardia sp. DSM 45834]